MRILDQRYNRPEHWGATKTYGPPWSAGQERMVLEKPPYKAVDRLGRISYCVPQSQSLLLTSSFNVTNFSDSFAFRWVLKLGGGGTQVRLVLDALNTQQISVAAENISVAMMAESPSPSAGFGFNSPNGTWTGSATISDGNVSSSSATYTQVFVVPNGTSRTLAIPPMATSFRILGNDTTTTSPFVAGLTIAATQPILSTTWIGNKLSQYNDSFIPIPGTASSLVFGNPTVNDIFAVVQWGLDL